MKGDDLREKWDCEPAHRVVVDQAWPRDIDWDYWKYRFRELGSAYVAVAGESGRLVLEMWCSGPGLSGRSKEWLCLFLMNYVRVGRP
jgi:hypothetical protein